MTVRRTAAVAGVVLLALTGCGGGDDKPAAAPGTPTTAASEPTAQEPTSEPSEQPKAVVREKVVVNAQGGGAGKGLCTLFSVAEMSERFGGDIGPGEVGGPLDSLCQWTSPAGGSIMIQRVPAEYWSPPKQRKGYKALTGVGQQAYTSVGMFGDDDWDAAALHGKVMTLASLSGPKANAASATDLLKETLTRG